MSMNKKIIGIIIFLSIFLFKLNVNAACSDVYNNNPFPTEEQCSQFTEDNFKCKSSGYTTGTVPKLICSKSQDCIVGYVKSGNSCVISNNKYTNISYNTGNNGRSTVNDDYKGNVAENPCDENDIRRVLKIFGFILLIAKIAVPFIIIGYGTFDLFKSVVDKDEKSLFKQLKQLGIRVVAGFLVFFVPDIIYAVFSLSDQLNVIDTSQYKTCAACLFEPTSDAECSVTDMN